MQRSSGDELRPEQTMVTTRFKRRLLERRHENLSKLPLTLFSHMSVEICDTVKQLRERFR